VKLTVRIFLTSELSCLLPPFLVFTYYFVKFNLSLTFCLIEIELILFTN